MTSTCPICDAPQDQGLACHACVTRLERDLAQVPALVTELDVTLSRQARIGGGGDGKMGKGWAREKLPINVGAAAAAWDLEQTLTIWAREMSGNPVATTVHASHVLLLHVNEIRRHPDVAHMIEKITQVITKARHAIDKPAERFFVGPCWATYPDEEGREVTCIADLYAKPRAEAVICKVPECATEHQVAERRALLLDKARDRLFPVREAAQMMGDVGGIKVTEDRIRGYLRRGRLAYHPIGDKRGIRLGDLLTVVIDDSEKKSGKGVDCPA